MKTTEPLSVTEAKSGHNFCDVSNVCGLIMVSAFNFFNTSGGRMSRTLSSLRLRDVTGVVQRVHCTDRVWKVPAFSFELVDEKSINKRGFRCVREDFIKFLTVTRLEETCYAGSWRVNRLHSEGSNL